MARSTERAADAKRAVNRFFRHLRKTSGWRVDSKGHIRHGRGVNAHCPLSYVAQTLGIKTFPLSIIISGRGLGMTGFDATAISIAADQDAPKVLDNINHSLAGLRRRLLAACKLQEKTA